MNHHCKLTDMTTEQTAQQLELAAQILRTGHPWEREFSTGEWGKTDSSPVRMIYGGLKIRPVLATPPDERPLHNPDNLTAEQVGVGWRLPCINEKTSQKAQLWNYADKIWVKSLSLGEFYNTVYTYRLPLSVPWPEAKPDPYAELKKAHAEGKVIQYNCGTSWEDVSAPVFSEGPECYRIKPEPAFQLPPPPPGMQWHRKDGWQEGDLPQGMRPLVLGEARIDEDQLWDGKWFDVQTGDLSNNTRAIHCKSRTRRPLTFTHAGKTWTWHRPGDPMPCDGERKVECVFADHSLWTDGDLCGQKVCWTFRGDYSDIIGWRYADEKKTVPFGPEDVRPLTRFRVRTTFKPNHTLWIAPLCANKKGIVIASPHQVVEVSYESLQKDYERNESLTTGKWNPDAWEPCHKQIDA